MGSVEGLEQSSVVLSNATLAPLALTVRCATSRTVMNVPSLPRTRTCVCEALAVAALARGERFVPAVGDDIRVVRREGEGNGVVHGQVYRPVNEAGDVKDVLLVVSDSPGRTGTRDLSRRD